MYIILKFSQKVRVQFRIIWKDVEKFLANTDGNLRNYWIKKKKVKENWETMC